MSLNMTKLLQATKADIIPMNKSNNGPVIVRFEREVSMITLQFCSRPEEVVIVLIVMLIWLYSCVLFYIRYLHITESKNVFSESLTQTLIISL